MTTDLLPGRWDVSPLVPCLDSKWLHVYKVDLNDDSDHLQSFEHLLSADERSRAERYRFAGDRSRYIIAHGALRHILSRYLQLGPAQLQFTSDPLGKPRLAGALNAADLRFSLAHAGSLALVAVVQGREVGVDIESASAPIDVLATARSAFSAEEVRHLLTLCQAQRRTAFFRIWTCKEAYLKAIGAGLSLPMDGFTVKLSEGGQASSSWDQDCPEQKDRWSLVTFIPQAGYAAAIAVEGSSPCLRYYCFSAR